MILSLPDYVVIEDGQTIGHMYEDAAEIAAAKTFDLNDWQRRRLLLRERA